MVRRLMSELRRVLGRTPTGEGDSNAAQGADERVAAAHRLAVQYRRIKALDARIQHETRGR